MRVLRDLRPFIPPSCADLSVRAVCLKPVTDVRSVTNVCDSPDSWSSAHDVMWESDVFVSPTVPVSAWSEAHGQFYHIPSAFWAVVYDLSSFLSVTKFYRSSCFVTIP